MKIAIKISIISINKIISFIDFINRLFSPALPEKSSFIHSCKNVYILRIQTDTIVAIVVIKSKMSFIDDIMAVSYTHLKQ